MSKGNDELFVDTPTGPRLISVKCVSCEYVDFPPQRYGCRRCGARDEQLRDFEILPIGTVVTSATVHLHPSEQYETPFTVAVVHLADGPVTRVVMTDVVELHAGDPVEGVLVANDQGHELRFQERKAAHA